MELTLLHAYFIMVMIALIMPMLFIVQSKFFPIIVAPYFIMLCCSFISDTWNPHGVTVIIIGAIFYLGIEMVILFDCKDISKDLKNECALLIVGTLICSVYVWYYNSRIEEAEQTVITQTEERTLLVFGNIPVQNVHGEFVGEINTKDNIAYCYINENNKGVYDSAPTADSKINIIEKEEVPRLEIVHYCKQRVVTDRNNGNEYITTLKSWYEYNFYVPKELKI